MSDRTPLSEADQRKWIVDTAEFAYAFGMHKELFQKLSLIIEAREPRESAPRTARLCGLR